MQKKKITFTGNNECNLCNALFIKAVASCRKNVHTQNENTPVSHSYVTTDNKECVSLNLSNHRLITLVLFMNSKTRPKSIIRAYIGI